MDAHKAVWLAAGALFRHQPGPKLPGGFAGVHLRSATLPPHQNILYRQLDFLTAFPPLQVINWITGSVVSLVALFYLGTLILYLQALRTSKVGWYIAALVSFILAMVTNEYAITLFPLLVLLTLAFWKDFDSLSPEKRARRAALYLMPFLLILIPYLAYQLHLLSQGTSEGVGLGGYRLGRHMLNNVTNLTHLVIPDLYFPRVTHFLQVYIPPRAASTGHDRSTGLGCRAHRRSLDTLERLVPHALSWCCSFSWPMRPSPCGSKGIWRTPRAISIFRWLVFRSWPRYFWSG